MKASKNVANHNGMNDTSVAAIVTIHKAGVSFTLCHMFVKADPAAIKLTALAVVDVITITNKAIIPKPSFDAIVDGSESFGSSVVHQGRRNRGCQTDEGEPEQSDVRTQE